MSRTFSSLAVPNYRRYAAGAIVSNTGTWMQRVAQDWLVLTVLTSHSAVAVGITTGLQFAPLVLLSPLAGLLADQLPKRKLMLATQAGQAMTALILGLLVITGTAQLWMVYCLAFTLGCMTALEAPARQTFVAELVPPNQLSNAVGLNSASFNAGRLIGPGVAGLLIAAFGTGPVFLINAVSFIAPITALATLRAAQLYPIDRAPREPGQIRAGLRYVRSRPDLMVILAIAFLVGTFALNFQLTTALMATQVFDKGATEYGLLGSIMAIGSLSGALLAARRANPRMRLIVAATLAFGLFASISALMPNYTLFALSLIPTGASALTLMTACNTVVQSTTEPAMRGRVMALYMAVFMGGTPLGAPVVGWIGEHLGARWSIGVGGIVAMLCAIAATAVLLKVQHRVVRIEWRPRPHLWLAEDPRAYGEAA